MSANKEKIITPVLCYTDTGGTFTDTFIVDEEGNYYHDKAPTTPKNLEEGYFASIEATAKQMNLGIKEFFSKLSILGYGATTGINTVLTRTGSKVGMITTKGFEYLLLMGRGKETWVGHPTAETIKPRTHRPVNPLVPISLICGATERISARGEIKIPLYEHEVIEAVNKLIKENVEAIVISFLFSWQNPVHELRAREIALDICRKKGVETPFFLSFEINPVRRELSRTNSTVIEAYTTSKCRRVFSDIEKQIKGYGFKGNLQIMQSTGGLATSRTVKIVETLMSGPVGGLIGGKFIGDLYGFDNIVTTDVGGTSFDVGLVASGLIGVDREPVCGNMLLGVPSARVISIGAGGGTIVKIDPITNRIEVGPESAGADPGPICYDHGGESPAITDVDVVLGYIDPDYFLGGRIKLNKDKAFKLFQEKISDPLNLDVYEAAFGVKDIIDIRMKSAVTGLIAARGYEISDYYCLAFGGAGPTHASGYTEDINFKGILMFPYSPVFSAFGAASADYEHHYTRALNLICPQFAKEETKKELGQRINKVWEELEKNAYVEMEKEGFSSEKVGFKHLAMVRYGRQLDDLIVVSPVPRINEAQDWDMLIGAFEKMYDEIFTRAAKYPTAGYEVFELGLIATVPKLKPKLRRYKLTSEKPSSDALKSKRNCFFREGFCEADVYGLDLLKPGNIANGPAIIESSTTTIVVPPNKKAHIDEYFTIWLR